MTMMEDALEALEKEKAASATSTEFYKKAETWWKDYSTQYRNQHGAQFSSEGMTAVMGLVRKWGPKLAVFAGLPGLGTVLGSMGTENGSFSFLGLLGKIGGIFGLG